MEGNASFRAVKSLNGSSCKPDGEPGSRPSERSERRTPGLGRAWRIGALAALLLILASAFEAPPRAQATGVIINVGSYLEGTLLLPTVGLSGVYTYQVTFSGVSQPTGFDGDDVTVTRGSVLHVSRSRGNANQFLVRVLINDSAGGNSSVFTVRANAIDQGNSAASITRTTLDPLTITMTSTAAEPVSSDFTVNVQVSEQVGFESGGEALVDGFFALVADPSPGITPQIGVDPVPNTYDIETTNCSVVGNSGVAGAADDAFTLTVRPSRNFDGTCTVLVPAGRVSPLQSNSTRRYVTNQESKFTIRVDTLTNDPALETLEVRTGADEAVALTPAFAPGTTSYEATVDSTVGQVTVNAVMRDKHADVTAPQFLQADGTTALADADADADGFQMDLDVGTNTVKIKATAQNGTTTRLYTLEIERMADTTAPSLLSTSVSGTSIVLTYSEQLDGDSQPAASAYGVSVDSAAAAAPSAVLVSGTAVTLTLASAVVEGASVRLTYTPPTMNPVQDLHGNKAGPIVQRELSSGGRLRLVGGTTDNEGRLEIFYDGAWGTVCDDFWTRPDADVACRALGFPAGSVDELFRNAYFGAGSEDQDIVLDDLRCRGKESSLLGCESRAVGTHNCSHAEDVGVRCVTQAAPWVIGIEANAPPGGTFNSGETLRVTLEWNEPVNVVRSTTGLHQKPRLLASLESNRSTHIVVQVEYASGTGTSETVFERRFTSSDFYDGSTSLSGTRVAPSSLGLRGGTIRSVSSGLDALLEHRGYPDDTRLLRVVAATVLGPPSLRSVRSQELGSRDEETGSQPGRVSDFGTWEFGARNEETGQGSQATAEGAWGFGDTIEATLTFSEPVVVDTTGGTPSIGLVFGRDMERSAAYVRGTNTQKLVFAYALTRADGTHTLVSVPANSLALNGGTIRSRTSGEDADLSHPAAQMRAGSAEPETTEPETPEPASGFNAELRALPSGHDGATAFTFELRFSENPGLGYRTVQDGLFEVSGGQVTHARRLVQGSNLRWEVTLQPSGAGDVTIMLPARGCTEENAACAGGQPLAQAVSATVAARPFTGSFASVPAEHGGSGTFTLEFHLSEAPAGLGWRTVKDHLFDVSGGAIERVRRIGAVRNQGWELTVSPSGNGNVTLTLDATTSCAAEHAVCTAQGRMLRGGLEATVKGPATLSVADAQVEEAEGATLDFVVTLSRKRSSDTTVRYATSDGTATAGSDYTAASGTLTIAAGKTSKTVSVAVLDDSHDEDSETLTFTLSNPSGAVLDDDGDEATGTITNDDPMPGAWIARFGRTVGSQVVEAIGARLGGTPSSHFTVGGVSLGGPTPPLEAEPLTPQDWLAEQLAHGPDARTPEERIVTGQDLLLGSSFHLASQDDAGRRGPLLSAWGRVVAGGFRTEVDGVTMDGDVTTGFLGFDAEWERLLAGVLLSRSEGDGAYSQGDGGGRMESALTGVYPYARLLLGARVSLWGVVGAGSGDLRLTWQGRRDGHRPGVAVGSALGSRARCWRAAPWTCR